MILVRKLLRLLFYSLLIVLAFVVGAVAVYTLTSKGRENLAALISDIASGPDRKVTITGIDGIWSGNFTMDQLVLEDAEGPWLAARGIEIDWSPMSLFSGAFNADLVAAKRIEVARPPKPSKEPQAKGGSSSLPVDISIKALSLPDIALGEAVTGGQVASIAAKAKADVKARPLSVRSDLSVERTDGTAGEVLADLLFAPDQNKLDIDLKASEPSGGILANLLKLPGKPAVDIIVTGSGPLANWSGIGTFSIDGSLITTVSGTHRLTGAGSVIEAKGDGEFVRFLPERFRALLEGKADFDIAATLTKDGGVDIDRAAVQSGALTASAMGSFDPKGATDLAVELAAKNNGIPLTFGTAESPIDIVVGSASIRALGNGREPGLDISAKLPSVSTNDVKLTDLALMLHSNAFNLSERAGPVIGSATAASLTIDNPTIAPLVAGEIGASLEGVLAADKLTLSKGTLRSDAIDGNFAGDVSLADGAITLQLDADVVSAALPAAARPLLGEKVVLSTSLERDSSGNVSANSLSVKSGGLTADGSARLHEGSIDAELNGALADIAPIAANASGAVSVAATAKGSLLTPDVDLTVSSDRVAFGERGIDNLELNVAGRADLANPQMALSLKGSFQGEAIEGKAVASTAGGARELRDIDFSLGPNRLTGALTLDQQLAPIGTVQFDFPELGRLAALANQTVEGAARGSAAFSKDGDVPSVKVTLNSDSIRRDKLVVGPLAVETLVENYLKEPALTAKVSATVADIIPNQPPAVIGMAINGTPAEVNAAGTVSIDGSLITTVSGTHRLTGAGSVIEAKGDGEFVRFLPARFRALLEGKADFDIAATLTKDGGVDIDRAAVQSGALTASAMGSFDPKGATDLAVELAAKNNGIPLTFGTAESPIDIVVGSASIRALGNGREPGLDISAKLPSVSTNDVKLTDLALMLHSNAFNLSERAGPVIGSATAASLTIDNPTIAPLVAGEIGASLEGVLAADKLTLSKGTLRSDAIDGNFAGDVSLADGAITLQLDADVVSAALPAAARPLLGEKVVLSTSLERDSSGNVSANSLSVKSGGLTADGSARLHEGSIDAELNGALADIAPIAANASGAVSVAATAKGSLLTPDVDLTVSSDRVAFGERGIDNLELNVAGRADLANPQMALSLKGSFQGEAIEGKAVASTAGGARELRDIDFSLGPNRLTGALTLDQQLAPIGTVQFDFPELGRLAALANQTVEGAARGSAAFSKDGDVPSVKVTLNSDSIRRDKLVVGPLAVETLVENYLKEPALTAKVSATVADIIPNQPPAVIGMAINGTPAEVNAAGTVSMGGTVVSELGLQYRPTEQGSAVAAKGQGEFSRFLPERLRQLVDGKTDFDIAATIAKAGPIQIEKAELANGALTASAAGSIDPAGPLDLTLQLGVGSRGVPLSFGTTESPIDLTIGNATIRAAGNRDAPSLDISASLPLVATNDVQLSDLGITLRSDAFNVAARSGRVKGGATASKLTIDNPTVEPLVAGALLAEMEGTLSTDALAVDKGILRSDAIDGGFGGTVSLANGAITLQLKADVLSAALPAAVRPALGEKLAISTSLERDTEGNVSANSLALQSGGLTGGGSIRLSNDQVDADVKGSLADVSALSAQAKGSIAFSATAKGALGAPDVALSVTSDKMTVAARDIENLQLTASGKADLAKPEASVTLKGTVGGEVLDGKAILNTADGQRAVKDLNLSLGKNRIVGSLSLDPDFVPDGTITFDLPDLGPLAALALETVEGSAKGTASFSRQGDAAQAKVALTSAGITRGDVAVKSVSIDALIANYTKAPGVSGKVRADEVKSGNTAVRKIDLDLSMDDGWTRFAGGAEVNAIPLKAAGRVKSAEGTTTVELASAQATVQGIKAALARPSTVGIAGGETTLDKVALNVGGGSVTVSGTAGRSLNLNAALSKLPASLVNNFAAGLNAAGTISGTVDVTGAAADPNLAYSVDWGGAETAQTRAAGAGAFSIKSKGTLASKRLAFDVNAGNGAGLTMKGGGTVDVAKPPQLNLKFDGAVPFAFLNKRVAAQGLALTGAATVNVSVSGAATAPVIGGTVRTSGARLVDARSGIAINDIAADVALGSGRATINRLTGKLSSGGDISASGSVGIAAPFPADIAVKLNNARYTDGQVVTTTLSGDLALKGSLIASPLLSGTINLARTVISIPERLPGSLRALDVKHKNAPAAVVRQDEALRPPAAKSGGGSGLALDLTINAPQRIFVQGRGLDAELGGSLRLTGSSSAPQAVGEFTMQRGRLSLLGKRLTFTRGILTFAGSLIPYLDMAAESRASDATVTVIVNGPANNPKFSFTSVPALPEDEVLARLIFGRAMSNLSPLQIAQLADAASQLAGGGGSTSLLNSLRDTLGVDDVDIKTNDDGSTAVSVGKYLNDRTYVTIEKGDKAGSGRAAIDLDVGRGIKLRGEARDDGEARGGIFYEKEY